MHRTLSTIIALALATSAAAQERPGEAAFRATYRELVETNTTHSTGSCTLAAERMAARLAAAGYPAADLHRFADPSVPKDGGLVAVLPGTDRKRRRSCSSPTSTSSRRSRPTGRATRSG